MRCVANEMKLWRKIGENPPDEPELPLENEVVPVDVVLSVPTGVYLWDV